MKKTATERKGETMKFLYTMTMEELWPTSVQHSTLYEASEAKYANGHLKPV